MSKPTQWNTAGVRLRRLFYFDDAPRHNAVERLRRKRNEREQKRCRKQGSQTPGPRTPATAFFTARTPRLACLDRGGADDRAYFCLCVD